MDDRNSAWCWFCGAKADLLCDGHLGWLKAMDGMRPVIDTRSPAKAQFTCDRPLCRSCVAKSIPITMRTTRGCEFHSWDFCADCVKEERDNFGSQFNNGMQCPRDLLTLPEGHAMQKRRLFQTAKPINDLERAQARIKELEALLAAGSEGAGHG